jgi:hypothetical protein
MQRFIHKPGSIFWAFSVVKGSNVEEGKDMFLMKFFISKSFTPRRK